MASYIRKDEKGDKALILLRHSTFARVIHWVGVPLLTLAIMSGLYMGNPFLGKTIPFRTLRFTHLTTNAFLSALLLGRGYYALVSGDYRNFLLRRGDKKRFFQLMGYYLFLKKEKPYDPSKYNVGQRIIYLSWPFAWLFQAITGIILANESRLVLAARLFGDLQTIRLLRYLVAVYFVITIFVHIYLALTTEPAKMQSIFSGYVRVKDGKDES